MNIEYHDVQYAAERTTSLYNEGKILISINCTYVLMQLCNHT